MTGLTCVFCGAAVKGRREHVLPKWLLKQWDGRGPYNIEIDGDPLAKSNGVTDRQELARVMLPVCGQNSPNDCNDWLRRTFEWPAQEPIGELFQLRPVSGGGVIAVAGWACKTLLLYTHPEAWDTELHRHRGRPWMLPADLLPGMRRTGKLPDDLSLYVARADLDATPIPLPSCETILLPRTYRSDGAGGTGASTTIGFGLRSGGCLVFQLVFHPLVNVEHPREAAGLVTRLWPNPPAVLDPRSLPVLDRVGWRGLARVFGTGGLSVGLEPGQRLPHFAIMNPLAAWS